MIPKTGRALDHIAFFAPDQAALEAWHKRLKGKVNQSENAILGGMVKAFFFSNPNGIVIEFMAEIGAGLTLPLLNDPDPLY